MSTTPPPAPDLNDNAPWYSGITRYQWMVLVIASLGWVFDIFEGQIFVASSNHAMPSFIEQQEADSGETWSDDKKAGLKEYYNNWAFSAFLVGGAFGGILFGILSDKIGRKRTMTLTIIFYSLFTCVSALSAEWWHLAGLRFLVAMGVGGEWAVASALVYEVFPKRARAHVGGIFHASSIFGTWLAAATIYYFIGNAEVNQWIVGVAKDWGIKNELLAESVPWRLGFAVGALPALLIIWIRKSLKEPEEWEQAKTKSTQDQTQNVGRISDLFASDLLRNTLVGFSLAAVGMATFWGVHVKGKEIFVGKANEMIAQESPDLKGAELQAEKTQMDMLGMFLVTTGGGLGLVLFGPISQRIGRRATFLIYHLAGLIFAWALFGMEHTMSTLYVLLPIFGFTTLGMHAGYAIYFPELFPTRLRSTGSAFCFNGGRIAAVPFLLLSGWLQKGTAGSFAESWLKIEPIGLDQACLWLSALYLVGAAAMLFAPETRTKEVAT